MTLELFYFTSGPRERVLSAILDAGHRVLGVYATDPDKWPKVRPSLEIAAAAGVAVTIVGKRDVPGLVGPLRGAIGLSAGFAYLFPREVIEAAEILLNVHGTLLPAYAGARTLNWVIECGERESGVTVHRIDDGVDTGPILVQRSFPISRFDTGPSLYRRTLEFEPELVVEALALYASGRAEFRPQPRDGVVRHPDRVPEHSELDPTRPLNELYDKIRAADPDRYPAYFSVDGTKVCVRIWRPEKPDDEFDMV